MNSENSKTSETYKLLLNLADKINLKRSDKYVALSNLSICSAHIKKYKRILYKNNKLKISTPTWNEIFFLPDGSCSVSDIEDYFEYILKQTWGKGCQSFNKNICK